MAVVAVAVVLASSAGADVVTTSTIEGAIRIEGDFDPGHSQSISGIRGVVLPTRVTFRLVDGEITCQLAYYDRSFASPVSMDATLFDEKGSVVAHKVQTFRPEDTGTVGQIRSAVRIPLFKLGFLTLSHPSVKNGKVNPDIPAGLPLPKGVKRYVIKLEPSGVPGSKHPKLQTSPGVQRT